MASRRSAAVILAALTVAALFVGSGTARAYGPSIPYGVSTPDGSFWLPYFQNIISTDPVTPGSTVFGDTLYLEFLNALGNRTVGLTTNQSMPGLSTIWQNESYSVPAHQLVVLTFVLPTSTEERNAQVCLDGGCLTFLHVSPLTLIPSGILTVGGLDLLAFGLSAEFGLLLFPLTVGARAFTRRVLWVPRFKAWLVAPHVAFFFTALVVFDYRAFDALFGGLGFVLIPVVFAMLYFLWVLHLFNVAEPVEVLRPDPQGGHALRYYRWRIFVGELPDGRRILIGTRWRDVLARFKGHAPTLVAADADGSLRGPPADAPVLTLRTETVGERKDRRAKELKARFRSRPGRRDVLDQFNVVGASGKALDPKERDPPRRLYWVDSDDWLSTNMPYLSFHRVERIPEVRDPTTGAVTRPATVKNRWAWPHYVVPSAEASLAGIHYYDVPVAALGWTTVEKLTRRMERLRLQNFALRSTPYVLADDATEAGASEIFTLLDRERFGLGPDENREESRSEAPKASSDAPPAADAEPTGSPTKEGRPRPTGGRA